MVLVLIFILAFMFLACLRIPIPFAVGLAGIIGMMAGGISISTIPGALFKNLNSFAYLAIPAFIYAGDIMTLGGITAALVNFVRSVVGRIKGSVGATTIITSALFGTISGSSVATVSAVGSMMLPEMVKSGYKKDYATALIAASGFLGILIPPSIPGVIYALTAGLPVHQVWLTTLVPGVILTTAYVLYNRIFYAKYEIMDTTPFTVKGYFSNIGKASPKGIVALLMPLIIFVGVYGGIMTPTEAGAVAVLYGLIAGWIIYPLFFKEKSEESLWTVTKKSAVTSATIALLIAFAAIPSTMFTFGQCAAAFTDFIFGVTESPIVFLLLVNVILIIVGMFMETNTAILLFAPILAPAAKAFGIDPLHFAAIMLLNLEIGMISPPFACNIFVSCKLSGMTMDRVLKPLLGFIAVCIPVLLLTTFIPSLSLAIVHLIG